MKDSRYDDLIEATTKRGAANSASLFLQSVVDRRTFLGSRVSLISRRTDGIRSNRIRQRIPAARPRKGWKAGTYSANVTGQRPVHRRRNILGERHYRHRHQHDQSRWAWRIGSLKICRTRSWNIRH